MTKRIGKLKALGKIAFNRYFKGPHFQYPGASPHLNIIDSPHETLKPYVKEYVDKQKSNDKIIFLDIGGGRKHQEVHELSDRIEYRFFDISPAGSGPEFIQGDICHCPQIRDNSIDIAYSNNVFEHVAEPWVAAQEISRFLKKGGLCITITCFAWRYHPCPEDYWRYSHSALKLLFEKYGKLKTLEAGYALKTRRVNHAGGALVGNLDGVPLDGYGGWLENWASYHIGCKE